MKSCFKFVALAAVIVLGVSGCGTRTSKPLLPGISGKAGEVIAVINKGEWEGELGNSIRSVLTSDCDFLPQREPLFTVADVPHSSFTNMFKVHRNILHFNISPSVTSPGLIYRNDVWAIPQLVIQVNATSVEQAQEVFLADQEKVKSAIEMAERDRIIRNTKRYEEFPLRKAVSELYGGSMFFPTSYNLKKKTNNFVWISYETTYLQQGFFVYSYPAIKDDKELSVERIVERRNEALKANVPGMFENTYMTTSPVVPTTVEYVRYKGRDFAQTRGFWEVYNDYMGGPFVSHSFYSKDGKDIIVIEGYVYAPKYDKRQYLRQVESILYSFEWLPEKEME